MLPWAGRAININSDEVLHKILQVCMRKGQYILHVAVIFDDQPPYGSTDRNVQTWLLASLDPSILGSEQTIVDGEGKEAEVLPQADMKVPRSKRKYRCRVCKADGHGKCTCKLVKPTAMVGPFTNNIVVNEIILHENVGFAHI